MKSQFLFKGREELDHFLARLSADVAAWAPGTAAAVLAAEATRAFIEPGLRAAPWPPLDAAVAAEAGRKRAA